MGRSTVEEEQNGKIICERIVPFEDTKKEIWLQFMSKSEFEEKEEALYELLLDSDGVDEVVIYLKETKQIKKLGANRSIAGNGETLQRLKLFLGENNVKVVEKNLEKLE